MQREYLTIIPRARMGSESIAHEAFGPQRPCEARGIIVFVKSSYLVENIKNKRTLTS